MASKKRRDHMISMLCLAVVVMLAPATCVFSADVGLIEPSALYRNPAAWIVLDGRSPADWKSGHIPGARSFSWENLTGTDEKRIPYKVRPPIELAALLGAAGIDEKTPVVVYGDADKSWGGEGWVVWVLSRLGHKGPVRLLKGGIQAWHAAGLPTKGGEEKLSVHPHHYRPSLQPQLDVSTAELRSLIGKATIIDTRSNWEWFLGRIPSAVHIPWHQFHTGGDRRPISADELKKLFAGHGIDPRKPVIYYCSGGVRSAYAWTVHELAGLPAARNYEAGMEEWKRDSSR